MISNQATRENAGWRSGSLAENRGGAKIDLAFAVLIGVLGLATGLAHAFSMNADALSYLEVGEHWWSGDFQHAISGYWSPLYPILIAGLARISPDRLHELTGPHLLHTVVLLGSFMVFRAILRTMERAGEVPEGWRVPFRKCAYSVFLWATLCMIDPGELSPDLLIVFWLLCACYFFLRMRGSGWAAAGFGGSLALGYLTKPILFPLGLVFVFLAACTPGFFRARRWPRLLLSFAVFWGVAAVYLVPLSIQKQHFTFSESGKLAYAWEVNGFSPYFDWQGAPPESGVAVHPTREILKFPPVFAFDEGRPGTYPLWYDASYWNEGLRPRIRLQDQARRLGSSAKAYAEILFRQPVPVMLLFSFVCAGLAFGFRKIFSAALPLFPLVAVSAAGAAAYALVFVLPRYLAPFAIFLGLVFFWAYCRVVTLPGAAEKAWSSGFALVTVLWVLAASGISVARGFSETKTTSYRVQERIARELTARGFKPGEKLAFIGRGLDGFCARLLRSQIVAEAPVLAGHPEWPATPANLEAIVVAFERETAARAVVSDAVPAEPLDPKEWHRVPGTAYYVRMLKKR